MGKNKNQMLEVIIYGCYDPILAKVPKDISLINFINLVSRLDMGYGVRLASEEDKEDVRFRYAEEFDPEKIEFDEWMKNVNAIDPFEVQFSYDDIKTLKENDDIKLGKKRWY